ncbi:methyl-accepting chemotaxis protein [Malikia granosa]|uniref:Methyl-accepting transducer domain-containing protein n=1 Tax=Malikia granosa TaxID=263067 RepID=A0A2S9K4B4_9BURK|nr:methyl-accepting chemotaxis protein [Malikia granosa]PRD65291.1 hypothetical protein C6P64_09820 [Malikia granosa]
MSQVFARRHLRGAHLFGLLLLLIVGASGQGALYWLEGIAADTQLLRQALQHQQQARQALDGLRTGIEQALQPQAQAEQEALTQDEASLFLDAHATEVGAALAALEALPLDEPSRSALQALRPTLKGRLADIQGVALIGLKTGSTNHLPAIRRALDRLTHELDQFQSLLLVELQASQQAAASARQQSQLALAALTGLALLTLLASGTWQDRKRQDQTQEEAATLQPPAQAPAQDRPQTVAIERAKDPQQGETLAMLRQLSQSTDQLTRLVSQIKTPPVATASPPTPARPAAAQVSRPPSAEPARAAQAPHPMADLAGAIDDIAFQSSMLAMNAEAARSGAPGQDIAQLVDEVRLLASRSAQTAKAFKSRIQPQPAIEPVTEPAREPAKANLAEPRQPTTLEPDDDDAGGVVVQIRQTVELPPAPLAAARKQQDKVVALEPHLAARQDDAEPQSAKAKPSSTVLRTGSLLRTRG